MKRKQPTTDADFGVFMEQFIRLEAAILDRIDRDSSSLPSTWREVFAGLHLKDRRILRKSLVGLQTRMMKVVEGTAVQIAALDALEQGRTSGKAPQTRLVLVPSESSKSVPKSRKR